MLRRAKRFVSLGRRSICPNRRLLCRATIPGILEKLREGPESVRELKGVVKSSCGVLLQTDERKGAYVKSSSQINIPITWRIQLRSGCRMTYSTFLRTAHRMKMRLKLKNEERLNRASLRSLNYLYPSSLMVAADR